MFENVYTWIFYFSLTRDWKFNLVFNTCLGFILLLKIEGNVSLSCRFLLLWSLILYVWVEGVNFFLSYWCPQNLLEISWWYPLVWVFFYSLGWALDKLFQSRKSCPFLSNISLIISFSCFLWSYFWSFSYRIR